MSSGQNQLLDYPRANDVAETDVERRCRRYRQAFLLMLREPFEELDSTLHRMLEVLATTLDVDRVSFWIFVDGGTAILCSHQFPLTAPVLTVPTVLNQCDYPGYFEAVSRQLLIAVIDVKQDPRTCELDTAYLAPLGIGSMLDVPVVAFGRFVGVLCHEHVGPPREWSVEEQHFASGVATQVALAHEREHTRRAQQAVLQRSLHDEETQLPNRTHLDNTLSECLDCTGPRVALVITSVDQYDYVLGSLGAQRMRELVRRFAKQLTDASPPGAFVARIAANEFALLLNGVTTENLSGVVEKWVAALEIPLTNGEKDFFLTLSTGYSYCDESHVSTAEALYTEAHVAALDANAEGGDRIKSFSMNMRDRLVIRARKEQDLRRGLAASEFFLHYQPIVDLRRQQCIAVEALLRWQHPQHGVVMPDEFISVAIESGVMLELGRHVIRMACEGIVQLRKRTGIEFLGLSINLSAPEILLPGTAAVIRSELQRANVAATALTIEITESAFMMDLGRAREALEEIRSCGVRIALDDFGTAYSSLSWLRQLPIDSVKIDRGFVADIVHNRRDLAIVKSIVGLAGDLDQVVVAEGIESIQQLMLLQNMGIAYGQGFYFARPKPTEQFSAEWGSD